MPRKRFLASNDFPYHVTARCLNKEWFALPHEILWEIFSDYLYFIHHAFQVRIHSFVLMPNHIHMIIRTPDMNLDKAMNYFMRETSRVIGFRSGRINQVYGGPYYWSLMRSPNYFLHAYKYVYRNPIEAALAPRVETYKFSTLPALLGQARTIIPVVNDETLFDGLEDQLKWLNSAYPSDEVRIDIKNALRKKEFHFAKDGHGKPHRLELELV